jgi:hypothetical protein
MLKATLYCQRRQGAPQDVRHNSFEDLYDELSRKNSSICTQISTMPNHRCRMMPTTEQ